VYIPTSVLMALHEERIRGRGRRAFHPDLRSLEPGRAPSSRTRPWPARAFAALSGRSHPGARRAGLAAARVHS
jgi:hypothetical protein